ncbi:MAG: hypothetical protein KDB32_07475 [Planctomycetes bacterium]|nr:hypothetical protein [Planctomycetota bacterium]
MNWTEVDAESSILWIQSKLASVGGSNDTDWLGNRLNCCLPAGYEVYIKVFHEVLEDLTVQDRNVTWDEAEESSSISDDALASIISNTTLERSSPEDGFPSRRVRWAELAARYGLKFHPEINVRSFSRKFPRGSWPRYLVGPTEGSLSPEEFRRLLTVLQDHASADEVFMYWDLPMEVQGKDSYCIAGELDSPLEMAWPPGVDSTPSYVWPASRTWIVHTNYDLSFTLVATNASSAYDLLSDDSLETIKIPYSARIDRFSDTVNG